MRKREEGLEAVGEEAVKCIKAIAGQRGLEYEVARDLNLMPGSFWLEAIACVRDACGDKGAFRGLALATIPR